MENLNMNYKYAIVPIDIIKNIDDINALDIISYVYYSMNVNNVEDKNIINLKDFINYIGRKPRSGSGNINNSVIDCYNNVVRNYTGDSREVDNIGEYLLIDRLTIPDGERYIKININHLNKIFNDKSLLSSSAVKIRAFNIYVHIVSNIYSRNSDINNGGIAEVCRDSYLNMSRELEINKSTVEKYMHKLFDLDLLVSNLSRPIYYLASDSKWRRAKTIYAIKNGDWESEINQGINQYVYALKEFGHDVVIGKDKA